MSDNMKIKILKAIIEIFGIFWWCMLTAFFWVDYSNNKGMFSLGLAIFMFCLAIYSVGSNIRRVGY